MTGPEIREFMQRSHQRRNAALTEIAATARALLPVLKDRQMVETAKDLEAKLFMLDAIDQEMKEFILADPIGMLETIRKDIEGGL